MAADVASGADSTNSCCAVLKKKCSKMEENRNALRQCVKLLEQQVDKLLGENTHLKKAYEEEQMRGAQEKQAKEKESCIRYNMEKELHDLKAEISSHQKTGGSRSLGEDETKLLEARILESEAEIKRLSALLKDERKRCDSEKKKAEAEKEKAAEARKLLMMEKSKAEENRRLVETERSKAEKSRLSLEKLKFESNEVRDKLIVEKSKAEDALKMVEAEKQNTCKEKVRTELERAKAKEQKKLLELVKKKATDEKSQVDRLSQQLEEEKQKREELQKKIEENVSTQSGRKKCSCRHGRFKTVTNSENADVKILKEQLKLEKKRVKYAKRMAQLEKAEIAQQFDLLKQDFVQLSYHLNRLDGRLSYRNEGKAGMAKIEESPELLGLNLQNMYLSVTPCNINSQSDIGLVKSYFNDTSNYPGLSRERPIHLFGGGCTRPLSGISSELESPIRDSVRNKSPISAVCSTTTTFSDRTFMGSQGRDDPFITTSAKLTGSSLNQRPAVRKLAGEVGKIRQNEKSQVVAEKTGTSCAQRNVGSVYFNSSANDGTGIAERESSRNLKRKMIQETLESIELLYSEDNQLHVKTAEKISALKDLLSFIPTSVCSPTCERSNSLDNGGLLTDKNDMCRRSCRRGMNTVERKRRKFDPQSLSQYDNQQQIDMFDGEGIRKPCFLSEIGGPNNRMRENVIFGEESTNAVSSDMAALICSENLGCEDYLKLLELDNDDERRYTAAVEMPLSPTLPEINSPRFQLYREDESPYLLEGLLRKSESERDNSLSFDTFDVIDLEINSNTSNTRQLLSDNNRDFTYSSKEPKCSGMFSSHNDFNRNGSVHGIEYNSRQTMPLVKCLWDPTKIPNSNASPDAVSGKLNKYSPSGGASHDSSKSAVDSTLLHEFKSVQCCNLEIPNLETNTSLIANGPEKALGTEEVPSSGLIKKQIEVEGKELDDKIIAQCVRHGLLNSGTRKLTDGENVLSSAGHAGQKSIQLVSESSTTTESATQMPLLAIRKVEDPCRGKDALKRIPNYCVVFSEVRDEGSISRIIHARNTLIYQDFMVQPEYAIEEVLRALTLKLDLLPEEKISVFFSWLLYNTSAKTSANSKSVIDGDILRCSESFAVKIKRVISDGGTSWLFQEICRLEILLNLIEDFLINRKILIYNDIKSEGLYPYVSSSKFFRLEEGNVNMCFSFRPATVDQLVTASVILSCICAAVNHIGYLLEASYKILRMCRSDTSWALQALHVFALVIGEKFFTLNNYSFLIAAIRLVVSLLERGHESLSPCLHSSCAMDPTYPRCEQCPFDTNAISVDRLTSFLLDMLRDHASGIWHPNPNKSMVSLTYTDPSCDEGDGKSTDCKYEFDDVHIDCDVSCVLFKYRKHATDQSDSISDCSFCHYTDIVSLMELVGCYMSWEWTYNNVMHRLLEMLESSKSEEFSAALFVLIGQLARFGIDANGYQQGGITELRCRLFMLLDTFITRKRSFPTEVAAVGSLLNLLPLSFGEIVNGYSECSVDASQSSHAKLIKKWFSHLSRELQSLSLSLFRHTDVQKF